MEIENGGRLFGCFIWKLDSLSVYVSNKIDWPFLSLD